jgi:hypothetical protein
LRAILGTYEETGRLEIDDVARVYKENEGVEIGELIVRLQANATSDEELCVMNDLG